MKNFIASLFLSLVLVMPSLAQDKLPARPAGDRLVNDLSASDFLSASEEAALESKLTAFANETSNQIVVLIVDDLNGMEAWEFASKVGDAWKVGQKEFDNGIVILIKPTGGKGQRDAFIAVGRGLGGIIPDATANQIKENELIPNLAAGQSFQALDQTTTVLMALAKKEYSSDQYGKNRKKDSPSTWKIILLVLFIIIFYFIQGRRGGRGGMTMGSSGIFFGSGMGRGFGGGFGGGGGGGGFGGFGGGSFGGGGAGGKW